MKIPGRPLEWVMVAGVVGLAAAAAVLWAPTAPAPTGRELPMAGQAPAVPQSMQAAAAPSSPSAYYGEQPAAPAQPAAAPVEAQPAPRAEPDRMLIAREHGMADASGSGSQSAAFSGSEQSYRQPSEGDGYRADFAAQDPKAVQLAVAQSGGLARPGAVRYGTGDRAELMGRGAGPVYNLKSNRAVQAGAVPDMGVLIQQAATLIEGARTQIQSSNLDQKTKDQALGQIHSAEAGLPGR